MSRRKLLAGLEATRTNGGGLELARGVIINKTFVTGGPFFRRGNQAADCCKNIFVRIKPKHPDPRNGSGVDENLLDVNNSLLFYAIV